MKCTYCGTRCKSEDGRRKVGTCYRDGRIEMSDALWWATPGYEDWMCPACQKLAHNVMAKLIAEIDDVVLAALRAQGGKT